MNPEQLGESCDIVKRFFCETMRSLDYTMYIDPMLPPESEGADSEILALFGARDARHYQPRGTRSCLLIDADKGISTRQGTKHVSFNHIAREAKRHSVVLVSDQSFSRSTDRKVQMARKLREMNLRDLYAFYYDSNVKFLFASRNESHLESVKLRLRAMGLPDRRLFTGLDDARRDHLVNQPSALALAVA